MSINIDIDLIDLRADARPLIAAKVEGLKESIGETFLVNPVLVRPTEGGRYELIAGGHRLQAHRLLGLAEIAAEVRELDDIDAELAMIDENLCRAELSPAEAARAIDRRKVLYEALHPETRHGATGGGHSQSRQLGDSADRFTAETARLTGQSERAVQRSAERGAKVTDEVLAFVRGTPLDSGVFLDQIKNYPAGEQMDIARARLNELTARDAEPKGERAARRDNDFYPTPDSIIAEIVRRWRPDADIIWEPCSGDGRIATAFRDAGYLVMAEDIADGQDFFDAEAPPTGRAALVTNPPFNRAREFIDHAFAIGVEKMCLVLPERFWASGVGREQFERHRPALWINLDWRDDYLGKGGSPDRALAVAIWTSPCADACHFDVWTRQAAEAPDQVRGGAVAENTPTPKAQPFAARPPHPGSQSGAGPDMRSDLSPEGRGEKKLSDDEANALIEAAYAAGNVNLSVLAEQTGLTPKAIKNRALRRHWSNPDNQKAAARKLMTAMNAARGENTQTKQEA